MEFSLIMKCYSSLDFLFQALKSVKIIVKLTGSKKQSSGLHLAAGLV